MVRSAKTGLSRRLLAASLIFFAFVLCDIALFGWLIFRSLSQREVERVLLETRSDAEGVAHQIDRQAERHNKDLYTAVAVERETRASIDALLRNRDYVLTVEIRDGNGLLVYQNTSRSTKPAPGSPAINPLRSPELRPPPGEPQTSPGSIPDIRVPIGELGSLRISISGSELAKRIQVLREELVRQAAFIGSVSTVLLLGAYVAVWLLIRRSRRLELQAAEAERMAYIGTLASGLAHEIRNPLNSLNLNMQMLEEEIDENSAGRLPTGKRLLSITRSEIDRLERLATDFLAYAKPHPLELEEVPAVRLLERLRELLAGEIQKRGARVAVEDRSGEARVRVDPAQINQLLLNLARNSFAAIEDAGRMPALRLAAYRQGSKVALELVDNGAGISPEIEGRIFELFYSSRKGGTGLGLAIVERIARAHGGEVAVKSTPGAGTTVTLYLPLAGAPEPLLRTSLSPSVTT